LHLDRNDYYGGQEAAFSLSEAEDWAESHVGDAPPQSSSGYGSAVLTKGHEKEGQERKLGFSRAYSLALAPHLIYARSNLLPALVSSRTHNQLEFQAVGSWFVVAGKDESAHMTRVPSGREDVFRDDSLDLKAKRSLMKFLRFVGSYDEDASREQWDEIKNLSIGTALKEKFGLKADAAMAPLLALALTPHPDESTKTAEAVPRIARHLRSIGMFGAGFSAVLPKWGGMSEIAQVACRACAVGGGVYVLGKSLSRIQQRDGDKIELELSDAEKVTTTWLVGCSDDLPASDNTSAAEAVTAATRARKGIFIVSSALTSLFPPTSEGGVTPAGAVIRVASPGPRQPPVHILVHSSESGECPTGQSKSYFPHHLTCLSAHIPRQ
jgi:Rab proteins geranylgeranyltransferase component A